MILAVQGESWKFIKDSAPALLGLLALMVLAILLFRWIRKRLLDHEDRATDGLGMLSQIRELHARGELTEEEYRSIKGRLIGKPDDAAAEKPAAAESGPKDETGNTRGMKDEG
jgi:hypothetical protein